MRLSRRQARQRGRAGCPKCCTIRVAMVWQATETPTEIHHNRELLSLPSNSCHHVTAEVNRDGTRARCMQVGYFRPALTRVTPSHSAWPTWDALSASRLRWPVCTWPMAEWLYLLPATCPSMQISKSSCLLSAVVHTHACIAAQQCAFKIIEERKLLLPRLHQHRSALLL